MNLNKLFQSKSFSRAQKIRNWKLIWVLGGDDGKECTYSKGYMKTQAIFSCLTCTPDANAGVCTACCLSCHVGHEVPRDEEGEPLYEDFICQLCSEKCLFLKPSGQPKKSTRQKSLMKTRDLNNASKVPALAPQLA